MVIPFPGRLGGTLHSMNDPDMTAGLEIDL
jgi:hypothetical protein